MNPKAAAETAASARARLTTRLAELNAEIRAYPQPIARCDAQLGGLVEERARIHEELDRLGPPDG
jgi:chromosome segregation ATPase